MILERHVGKLEPESVISFLRQEELVPGKRAGFSCVLVWADSFVLETSFSLSLSSQSSSVLKLFSRPSTKRIICSFATVKTENAVVSSDQRAQICKDVWIAVAAFDL